MERRPVSALKLDPRNARRHPDANIEAIKVSLARFGQQKPVVVDAADQVVAGNGTVAAARALGWSEVQVVVTKLSGDEIAAYAIADNRVGETSEWDEDILTFELERLADGFPELGSMFAELAPTESVEELDPGASLEVFETMPVRKCFLVALFMGRAEAERVVEFIESKGGRVSIGERG